MTPRPDDPQAEWAAAFVAAQAEMPDIPKDKTAKIPTKSGREYSYSYADLASIIDKTRPVLAKHKLAAVQSINSDAKSVSVYTRIYHEAGHVEAFGPLNLAAGSNAQESGSAITYARRYALCAALGIAPDDDDDASMATKSASGAEEGPPKSGPGSEAEERARVWGSTRSASSPSDSPAQPSEEAIGLSALIVAAVNDGRVTQLAVIEKALQLLQRNDQAPPKDGIDGRTLPSLGSVILKALIRDLGLEEKASV